MKSLRSTGNWQAARACSRYATLPWKNCTSVSTDRQAAPCFSYERAICAGTKSSRNTPFDGLAFFTSAITAARPAACFARNAPTKSRRSRDDASRRNSSSGALCSAARTSSRLTAMMRSRMSLISVSLRWLLRDQCLNSVLELLREANQFVDFRARLAACNGFARKLNTVRNRRRHIRRIERRARVQRDDLARAARLVVERLEQHRFRLSGIRHFQRAVRHHLHAEVFRMNLVLVHFAVAQLADLRCCAERDFVHAVHTVHHEHMLCAEALH